MGKLKRWAERHLLPGRKFKVPSPPVNPVGESDGTAANAQRAEDPYLPDHYIEDKSSALRITTLLSPKHVWRNVRRRLKGLFKQEDSSGEAAPNVPTWGTTGQNKLSVTDGIVDEDMDLESPPPSMRKKWLTEAEELDLTNTLHFHPIEVKMLKQYFRSLCAQTQRGKRGESYTVFRGRTEERAPDEQQLYLTKDQLRFLFFHGVATSGPLDPDRSYILDSIFNAINFNRDGYVSFAEFAVAMSVCLHGTFRERATCESSSLLRLTSISLSNQPAQPM